ncbi:hypothetical protein [Paraburkholderia sp. J94]|uniref:hypothetical protein n=1 Tax=Paraburkholderia sp. J94 TaxID=2805441 RepID=UPI002AB1ABE4|nr:hypothetical protein [Paraburkholderia sp. J94]
MSLVLDPPAPTGLQDLVRQMRAPAELMLPERLAAIQPSRVSASRSLMTRALRERWSIVCTRFDIDARGNGIARYRIDIGSWRFTFPVFSKEPSAAGRTGRIIGRSWDMMAALVEGDMSDAALAETQQEMPKLYEGRATPGTLIWCRSNRSGRFFDHALQALAAGRQPDVAELAQTCYLMRNTGLDGNGTFGTRSFLSLEADHPLRASLSAQMLCAYMMRVFAQDLLAHLARAASSSAVELAAPLRRFLGVGNGSALGLMLFVNNHPRLIDRWLWIREEALARARVLKPDAAQIETLLRLIDKAIVFRREDRAAYEQVASSDVVADALVTIRAEVQLLLDRARANAPLGAAPFATLCASLAGRVHQEGLETLHSLLIELVPDEADALAQTLVIDEELRLEPAMRVGRLREMLRHDYAWAFAMDLDDEAARYVWYKSVTAEEPRRGPREEVGDAINLALDLPRQVVRLDAELARFDATASTASFLAQQPWHRAIVTRVQALHGTHFHSPHADIMSEGFVPAHITRLLNVGVHGIDKTRDFLNRNLRGVLFHGAPTPEDLQSGHADPHWFYPAEPTL